jgi:hypothetical protein
VDAAGVAAQQAACRTDATPADTRRAGVSLPSTLAGDPPIAEDRLVTERSASNALKSHAPTPLSGATSRNRPPPGF